MKLFNVLTTGGIISPQCAETEQEARDRVTALGYEIESIEEAELSVAPLK